MLNMNLKEVFMKVRSCEDLMREFKDLCIEEHRRALIREMEGKMLINEAQKYEELELTVTIKFEINNKYASHVKSEFVMPVDEACVENIIDKMNHKVSLLIGMMNQSIRKYDAIHTIRDKKIEIPKGEE